MSNFYSLIWKPEFMHKLWKEEHQKECLMPCNDIKTLYENNTFELTNFLRARRALEIQMGLQIEDMKSNTHNLRMHLIRVVLGLAANLDLEVEQMDVKTLPSCKQAGDREDCVSDDFIILLQYCKIEYAECWQEHGRIAHLEARFEQILCYEDMGPANKSLARIFLLVEVPRSSIITRGKYIEKGGERRSNMDKAKVVSSLLTPNFKLTDKDCPSSKKNIEKMDRVPYASAVGSLMYAMGVKGRF
ncbi:hypothetical protein Tco_0140622 [Tanacetum coccineum]